MSNIPVGRLGLILAGPERGRIMEVLDDGERTGGFLILTYSDFDRSPEVFDVWFEGYDDLVAAFNEVGWQVEWRSTSSDPSS